MTYKLLNEVLKHLEAFDNTTKNADMMQFVMYLNTKFSKPNNIQSKALKKINTDAEYSIEASIGRQIFLLLKYIKMHGKKVLDHAPISTLEEFSFLATLISIQPCSKTQLISAMVSEKPVGIEIIKRLSQKGFIAESSTQADKRSTLIECTPNAHKMLGALFPQMSALAHLSTGNLTIQEKVTLMQLLNKLEIFHQEKVCKPEYKNLTIEELIAND
jgi:MarR family transcriptional regulator, lower aerobic nicotinate degradation pathway regulator